MESPAVPDAAILPPPPEQLSHIPRTAPSLPSEPDILPDHADGHVSSPPRDDDTTLVDASTQPSTTSEIASTPFPSIPGGHPTTPSRAQQALDDSDAASDSGSGRESDAYDEDSDMQESQWEAIVEDETLPCDDEMKFIESQPEHSATDHIHWQKEAGFDSDPNMQTIDLGRIEWLVDRFNGTKEDPNNERLMRSPTVQIGGHEWQLKFYPHGNRTHYLSVYLECTSMRAPGFAATEDFDDPPFPFLAGCGQERPQKRRSVAVQYCVIMYNPAEPRTYEAKFECHQYHKDSPDHGWPYFSDMPRSDFHRREHKQRQAILRNDNLAFVAHIRVVEDASGSLWEHYDHREGSSRDCDRLVSITGLRPWYDSSAQVAACVTLLHFKPFRELIHLLNSDAEPLCTRTLRKMLRKMYTRQRTRRHMRSKYDTKYDIMEMFWALSHSMIRSFENRPGLLKRYSETVSTFDADQSSNRTANRLPTKQHPSIQAAIDNYDQPLGCPALLVLELQRQEHDKSDRKWKKIMTDVKVQDEINAGGFKYTLFAFITHFGHLQSARYNTYVRPRGIGNGWYAYTPGSVTRLSEEQARCKHSGRASDDDERSSYSSSSYNDEVTQVVLYVREDHAEAALARNVEESWALPLLQQTQNLTSQPPGSQALEVTMACSDIAKNVSASTEELSPALSTAAKDDRNTAVSGATESAVVASASDSQSESTADEDVIMHDTDQLTDPFSTSKSHDTARSIRDHTIADSPTVIVETREWLGQAYFQGECRNGEAEGHGHQISSNGDEYVGSFRAGVYHGKGKMIFSSTGDIYEGTWSDGLQDGQGKLTELSTGNVFEGGWKAGKKHGPFVLKGEVTEDDRGLCSICYENEISIAFGYCGHVVACSECANMLDICPVCRKTVDHRLQLFGVKISLA